MKAKLAILLTAARRSSRLILPAVLTGANPQSQAVAAPAELAADGQAQHIALGDGRYVAIIPAAPAPDDVYEQGPSLDTYVDSYNSTTSYCNETSLRVEYDFAPDSAAQSIQGETWKRAYLGFDLSSIPSQADVTLARLYAYLDSASGKSPVTIAVRRVTSAWNCPLDWSPQPSSEHWVGAAISLDGGWWWSTITSLVETHWLGKKFGTADNYGLALNGPESGGDYYRRYFRSSNYSGTTYDPYLRVEYSLPTPTPTPTNTPTKTRDKHTDAHSDQHADRLTDTHPDTHTHAHRHVDCDAGVPGTLRVQQRVPLCHAAEPADRDQELHLHPL